MNDNMEQFLEGYEKVDSKPKVMKTDPMWEPNREMTPRTARAFWLEQEVVALQGSLARLSEGTSLKSSAYWAKGFHPPTGPPVRLSNSTEAGAGAAEHLLQARAGIVSSQKEGGGHSLGRCGEHLGQARASKRGFEHLGQDRACAANFEHLGEDHGHSLGGSGDQRGRARASALDLEHPGECPGDLLGGSGAHQRQDQAGTFGMGSYKECHGPEGPHQARALHGHGTSTLEGLRDNGPGSFTDLPRHGVGGGGIGEGSDRVYGPWSEGGSMNTKTELPDLPATSSPLQFGDWLHLSTPSMKDISGVAGWWWESTLREAKCYYEQWKTSSPLQRIQIRPQLPESLSEHRFQRTEQRGVQMLLKAIPLAEQQELVTDRSLSSTAILYKLMVRFQPGGAGEKQILLQQLTNMEKSSTIQEVAAAIRNWRRHFGRAEEVQAVLPDGILLLKALDEPLQKIASLDQQAAFRLSQSRMQLQLDQQPTQRSLWAFSQCLLAEAETLVLLQSSTSSTTSTPLKLKQLEGKRSLQPRWPLVIQNRQQVQRLTNHAATSCPTRAARLARAANGSMTGRALQTKEHDVLSAAARSIERMTASCAPKNQVSLRAQGEELDKVVEVKMQPHPLRRQPLQLVEQQVRQLSRWQRVVMMLPLQRLLKEEGHNLR